MTALTRGPLPAQVYWRRRMLLLVVLLGLVVGVVRLTGLGSEPAADPQARQVSAEPAEATATTGSTSVTSSDTPSETRAGAPTTGPPGASGSDASGHAGKKSQAKRDRGPVLAEPEGVCSDRDVAVTPSVRRAVGGRPVTFTLELRTISSAACTWHVAPSTLTMKLTSGDDDIWSSQDCPRAIPSQDVVVRNNVATMVDVTWSAKRSDDDCNTRYTEWAMPGWYYVEASALAGEPSDLHFELTAPDPEVKLVKRDRDTKSDQKKADQKKADQKKSDQEKSDQKKADRKQHGADGRR